MDGTGSATADSPARRGTGSIRSRRGSNSGTNYPKNDRHNYVEGTTDPSGLEIWLYTNRINKSGRAHYDIVWYDPDSKHAFAWWGGGPGTSDVDGKWGSPCGHFNPLDDDMKKEGVNDPAKLKEYFGHYRVLVKTDLDVMDELKKLNEAFVQTDQIPVYNSFMGPNSNTYAHQLFVNAGIPVKMPLGAPGWDYCGDYGYGGPFYDRYGKEIPESKERLEELQRKVLRDIKFEAGRGP